MYSLIYSEVGVQRCAEVLGEEVERAMRLLGARSVNELTERMVNTREIEMRLFGASRL